MTKKILLGLIMISLLIMTGCSIEQLSEVSDEDLERVAGTLAEKAIVCNEPYMRYASGCCLDKNKDNICDNEVIIEDSAETSREYLLEEEVSLSLEEITKYSTGVVGAKGNFVSYRLLKDEHTIMLSELCEDPECKYTLLVNNMELELHPYGGITGNYLMYYCDKHNCIEDFFGSKITATLRIIKEGTIIDDTRTIELKKGNEPEESIMPVPTPFPVGIY